MSRFLSRLLGLRRQTPIRSKSKRRGGLRFDWLEDRTVPATVHVGVVGDFGVSAGTNGSPANELAVAKMVNGWDQSSQLDGLISTGDNTYPNASKDNIDVNIGQYYSNFI